MAGITNLGVPSSDNYQIGRGALMLDLFDDSGNDTKSFLHLGNCTSFALTVEEETLEHQNNREELAVTDVTVTLTKSVSGSAVFDEITKEIQQLFFSGALADDDLGAAIVRGSTANRLVANYAKQAGSNYGWVFDKHTPLYADGTDLADSTSPRLRNMLADPDSTKVEVFKITGDVQCVVGDDYDIDEENGTIIIHSDGTNVSGYAGDFSICFATAEEDIPRVNLLQKSAVRGRLMFVGENAANGDRYEVFLNKVKLQADGDHAFIGDDFSAVSLTLTAEKDETYDAASPIGSITRIDQAF